jgi:ABC-type cobalamin transport system ATPase subunit
MSEILKEEQWQRRRAAKLQLASQPQTRPGARLLLLKSQPPRLNQGSRKKK